MHRTVYVEGYIGEGHGHAWTLSGIERRSTTCGLYRYPSCEQNIRHQFIRHSSTLTGLGRSARHLVPRTCWGGRQRKLRAFKDKCAVVHPGDVTHELMSMRTPLLSSCSIGNNTPRITLGRLTCCDDYHPPPQTCALKGSGKRGNEFGASQGSSDVVESCTSVLPRFRDKIQDPER